jgi:hypothetical protein
LLTPRIESLVFDPVTARVLSRKIETARPEDRAAPSRHGGYASSQALNRSIAFS